MENAKIKNMYDLSQSIAGEYLSQFTYLGGKECNRCAYGMSERTADY